jgi:Spy/CpxP family protein refolding chaperone
MTRIRTLALLALVAAPLAAQQPAKPDTGTRHRMMMGQPMPHMMQMEQMMAPMMRAMAFTPDHLLARKDSLNLTPQQITRLTTLRDASKSTHDAAAAGAKMHMDAMAQALSAASPDTAAVKAHFQEAHTGMGKAMWAMLGAAAQARAMLTDEQRARVDRWASMTMEHRMERH